MPDKRDAEFYSDIAKAGQIAPSFLRMVCRARFECVPPEILEEARLIALRDLKRMMLKYDYAFLRNYETILSHSIGKIIRVVEDATMERGENRFFEKGKNRCRIETFNGNGKSAKTLCWTCPMIRDAYEDLKNPIS